MEKARESLKLRDEESELVSRLNVPPHRVSIDSSFYEDFTLKGIRVDRVDPGFIVCTFKVPPRHTCKSDFSFPFNSSLKTSAICVPNLDRSGKLCTGAIANLVDEVGGAVVNVEGLPRNVSVDMSISFLSTAKLDDELEITSRVLGQRGGYFGTIVLIRNKATGEVVAEGRHSLFGKHASKL
ncbi:hypothetical protein HYC85_023842 [Camellia sinensis]|uniref:Thioesterase domain-containing protein n=1 Tax=Camellia sinensis TaxID=4442 RepID=A0A7J7GFM9_CAMSI|nr:hypothetical protein HYC85_023842 [Camellia sinensis]